MPNLNDIDWSSDKARGLIQALYSTKETPLTKMLNNLNEWDTWYAANYKWLSEVWRNRRAFSSRHSIDYKVADENLQCIRTYEWHEMMETTLRIVVFGRRSAWFNINGGGTTHCISGFVEQVGRLPKPGEFVIFYDRETSAGPSNPNHNEGWYTIGISPLAFLTQTNEDKMLQQHVTPSGERILIAQMSDEDLYNTVHTILQTAIDAKGTLAQVENVDRYKSALYGITPPDPENVADIVRQALTRSYPYLAECYLRGIDEVTDISNEIEEEKMPGDSLREMLKQVVEREGQMEGRIPSQLLLGGGKGVEFISDDNRTYRHGR